MILRPCHSFLFKPFRYVVHNKMMNFMAPSIHEKWSYESKEELYNSLFGQADKMK
jgi:hypothetical protein